MGLRATTQYEVSHWGDRRVQATTLYRGVWLEYSFRAHGKE